MSVNLKKSQGFTWGQIIDSLFAHNFAPFFSLPFVLYLLASSWCPQARAQPTITSLQLSKSSSEFTVLSGTGFGAFNGEVLSWDNFEDKPPAASLHKTPAIDGYPWSNGGDIQAVVDKQFAISGSQSVKLDGGLGKNGSFGWKAQSPSSKLYISYWRRVDGEGDNRQLVVFDNTKAVQVSLESRAEGCWQLTGKLIQSRQETSNSSAACSKQILGKFQRWDLLIDPQTATLNMWLDNLVVSTFKTLTVPAGGFSQMNLGFSTTSPATGSSWFDDVYIASTPARVEACNASEYMQCTHRHLQYVATKNWGATEIRFRLHNLRALRGEPIYLYVIDSQGQVSNGIAIARPVIKAN